MPSTSAPAPPLARDGPKASKPSRQMPLDAHELNRRLKKQLLSSPPEFYPEWHNQHQHRRGFETDHIASLLMISPLRASAITRNLPPGLAGRVVGLRTFPVPEGSANTAKSSSADLVDKLGERGPLETAPGLKHGADFSDNQKWRNKVENEAEAKMLMELLKGVLQGAAGVAEDKEPEKAKAAGGGEDGSRDATITPEEDNDEDTEDGGAPLW